MTGAPDSLKQGNYDYFPKMGDLLVLFLGEEHNYRLTNLTDPLISQVVWAIYHQEPANIQSWISQTFRTKFTLPELKDKIKNPVTEPTLLPLPPTPTPAVKAGQTLQPVTAYGLAKAKSTYQKGPQSKPELWGSFAPDSERFTRLVKALDQPLLVEENLKDYYSFGNEMVQFGFEFSDGTIVSFVYDPKTSTLIHSLPPDGNSRVKLQSPPGLKEALGLN